MQIVAISRSKSPQKVWLKFNDDSYLPFRLDDIVKFKLTKFTDLDSKQLSSIYVASAKFILTEYALRQIAISPKVRNLLSQKLNHYSRLVKSKYNYPEINYLVDEVIDYVSSLGLLDEQKFIEFYVRRHPKMSQMQIKYNLSKLGIKYQITSSDLQAIKSIVSRKISHLNLSDIHTKTKLITALVRKGFPINQVKTVIDEMTKVS